MNDKYVSLSSLPPPEERWSTTAVSGGDKTPSGDRASRFTGRFEDGVSFNLRFPKTNILKNLRDGMKSASSFFSNVGSVLSEQTASLKNWIGKISFGFGKKEGKAFSDNLQGARTRGLSNLWPYLSNSERMRRQVAEAPFIYDS